MAVATPWREVVKGETYQGLDDAGRAQMQRDYFVEVVLPQVGEVNRDLAWGDFTKEYPLPAAPPPVAAGNISAETSLTAKPNFAPVFDLGQATRQPTGVPPTLPPGQAMEGGPDPRAAELEAEVVGLSVGQRAALMEVSRAHGLETIEEAVVAALLELGVQPQGLEGMSPRAMVGLYRLASNPQVNNAIVRLRELASQPAPPPMPEPEIPGAAADAAPEALAAAGARALEDPGLRELVQSIGAGLRAGSQERQEGKAKLKAVAQARARLGTEDERPDDALISLAEDMKLDVGASPLDAMRGRRGPAFTYQAIRDVATGLFDRFVAPHLPEQMPELPEDAGVLRKAVVVGAYTAGSFADPGAVMDLMGGGKVSQVAAGARRLQRIGGTAGRALQRGVAATGGLTAFEVGQAAQRGDTDAEKFKAGLHGGSLGFALGIGSLTPTLVGKFATEYGIFALGSPLLEGRLPGGLTDEQRAALPPEELGAAGKEQLIEDLVNPLAVLGFLKIQHALSPGQFWAIVKPREARSVAEQELAESIPPAVWGKFLREARQSAARGEEFQEIMRAIDELVRVSRGETGQALVTAGGEESAILGEGTVIDAEALPERIPVGRPRPAEPGTTKDDEPPAIPAAPLPPPTPEPPYIPAGVQPPGPAGAPKKAAKRLPWQMTGQEYLESLTDAGEPAARTPGGRAGRLEGHKAVLERALKAGKPVPEAVLAEYPDLAAEAKLRAEHKRLVEIALEDLVPSREGDVHPGERALAELARALEAGDVDEGAASLARDLVVRDPSFDLTTALRIAGDVLEAPGAVSKRAGVREGAKARITGMAIVKEATSGLRAAVGLYKGADAETVVHEFFHDWFERLDPARRGVYERYHAENPAEGREDARERFALEGTEFFFSERMHETAGGIRALFREARATLRELIKRVRAIRGATLPPEIIQLYRDAGNRAPASGKAKTLEQFEGFDADTFPGKAIVALRLREREFLRAAREEIQLTKQFEEDALQNKVMRDFPLEMGFGVEGEAPNELHIDDIVDRIDEFHRKGLRAPSIYYHSAGLVGGAEGMRVRSWAAKFDKDPQRRPSGDSKRHKDSDEWLGWRLHQVDRERRDTWMTSQLGLADEGLAFPYPGGLKVEVAPEVLFRALDLVLDGKPLGKNQLRLVMTVAEWAEARYGDEYREDYGDRGIEVPELYEDAREAMERERPEDLEDLPFQVREERDREGEGVDLIALHNTTEEGIERIRRMGGVPMPSIAVTKRGVPFSQFGYVTLVAPRAMVDPAIEGNRTFEADIYSPTLPPPEHKTRRGPTEKLGRALSDIAIKLGHDENGRPSESWYDFDDKLRRGPADLAYSLQNGLAGRMLFLEERGVDVVIPKKPGRMRSILSETPAMQKFYAEAEPSFDSNDPKLLEAVKLAISQAYRGVELARRKQLTDSLSEAVLRETTIDSDGELTGSTWQRLIADRVTFTRGTNAATDVEELTGRLVHAIEAIPKGPDEFRQWVNDKVDAVYDEPQLKLRGRKVLYTAQNALEWMRAQRSVKATEQTMTFGPHNAPAAAARPFKDVEDMRFHAEYSIVGPDQYRVSDTAMRDQFMQIADALQEHARYPDTWDNLDGLGRAIGAYGRTRKPSSLRYALARDYRPLDDELFKAVREYADRLFEAPVPYFESKPDRIVQLGEFAGAVVPNNVGSSTLEALRKAGITNIRYYEPHDQDGRAAQIDAMDELHFQVREEGERPSELGLFSGLARAVGSMPMGAREPGGELLRRLKKMPGVKADELAWTGLDELLESADTVTRDEVLGHLSRNAVRIVEKVYGYSRSMLNEEQKTTLDAAGREEEAAIWAATQLRGRRTIEEVAEAGDADEYQRLRALAHEAGDRLQAVERTMPRAAGEPNYDRWSTPGGTNYREVLLLLGSEIGRHGWDRRAREEHSAEAADLELALEERDARITELLGGNGMADYPGREFPAVYAELLNDRDAVQEELSSLWARGLEEAKARGFRRVDPFYSGHWNGRGRGNENANIIAHLRLKDFKDADGKATLLIEEIQSDWALAGRQSGIARQMTAEESDRVRQIEEEIVALNKREQELFSEALRAGSGRLWSGGGAEHMNARAPILAQIRERHAERSRLRGGDIPDGPFIQGGKWQELVLKRALRIAAEGGYDRLAWTTGQATADRYSLKQAISSVDYWESGGNFSAVFYDRDGHRIDFRIDDVPPERLHEYVGREVAAQMLKGEGKEERNQGEIARAGEVTYRTLDAASFVQPEWPMRLYDDVIPVKVAQITKRWGGLKARDVDLRPVPDVWEVFDPRDGVPLYRAQTEEEAKRYIAEHPSGLHLDYDLVEGTGGQGEGRVHGIDLPDAMREDIVRDGLPLFQVRAEEEARTREVDYAIKRARSFSEPNDLMKALMPLSERARRVSPEVERRMRQFVIQQGMEGSRYLNRAQEFLEGVKRQRKKDAEAVADLERSLWHERKDEAHALADGLGLLEALRKAEEVDAELLERYLASGGKMDGLLSYHFPRRVKDYDGLMDALYNSDPTAWGEIQRLQAEFASAHDGVISSDDQIRVANAYLASRVPPASGRPGGSKERGIEEITEELRPFYYDLETGFVRHVEEMERAILKNELFGRDMPRRADTQTASLFGEEPKKRDSIGAFLNELISEGVITAAQQREVKDILEAMLMQRPTPAWVQHAKTATLFTVMGSPISAITQFGDLAWSLYENGFWDTAQAAGRSVRRKSTVTKADLGIDSIAREFSDLRRGSEAVDRLFRLIGIDQVDAFGKEVLVNAALERYRRQARKGKVGWKMQRDLDRYFGRNSADVLADLAAGRVTDRVLVLLANKMMDYHPTHDTEVPAYYHTRKVLGPLSYNLRTFTVKQLEVFRREAYDLVREGRARDDAALVARGMGNLARLAALFTLMNSSTDALKDLLLGRDIRISSLGWDALWRLLGVSRYVAWQYRREGPVWGTVKAVAPPALSIPENIVRDINQIHRWVEDGEGIQVDKLRSIGMIPVVGKPYYWWQGGGAAWMQEQRDREEKSEERERTRTRRGRRPRRSTR